MTRWNRYGVSFGVMAALLLSLPFLAALQYRWVGQVSQSQLERLHSRLHAETARFAEEFNGGLRDAYMVLQAPGPPRGDFDPRYERAMGTARHLIRNLYVAEASEQGRLDLFQVDRDAGGLAPVEWPESLAHLRDRLQPRPRGAFGPVGPPIGAVDDGTPVLIAPRARPPRPGRPPFGGPARGWIIAELDLPYLQDQLFPELVRTHFPDYDVRIVRRAGRSRVIYSSDPKLSADDFSRPDSSTAIFSVRPPALAGEPSAPHWQVLTRRRAGSLETLVEQARQRDLAISFAILFVLAAGILMLLVSTRRAQRLAELQMDFVAGVSHELRTPLSVICSAADNLADGLVANPAQVKRYGSLIRGEGHRLSEMVEQILRFAGIQSGRARYELKPAEVSTILDRALAMCRTPLLESGCEVEKRIDPGLPAVMADATSLAHCVGNLVSNAAKYGRAGKWIGLRAWLAEGGGEVRISVEDKGPGIEPADLPHLFEPFYRGSRAIDDQIHGAGLGLSLVKRIVEAHAGAVEVSSEREVGACFTLRIKTANGTTNPAG